MKAKLLRKIRKEADIKITFKKWSEADRTRIGRFVYSYVYIIKNSTIYGEEIRFDSFMIELFRSLNMDKYYSLIRDRENRISKKNYQDFKNQYFN